MISYCRHLTQHFFSALYHTLHQEYGPVECLDMNMKSWVADIYMESFALGWSLIAY